MAGVVDGFCIHATRRDEESVFFAPFIEFPPSVDETERDQLRVDGLAAHLQAEPDHAHLRTHHLAAGRLRDEAGIRDAESFAAGQPHEPAVGQVGVVVVEHLGHRVGLSSCVVGVVLRWTICRAAEVARQWRADHRFEPRMPRADAEPPRWFTRDYGLVGPRRPCRERGQIIN